MTETKNFNLVLTSNGFINSSPRSKEIDELFGQIARGKKVLLIANAASVVSANYIARVDVKQNFENVGAKIVDVIDIDEHNVAQILDYDVIYITGGQLHELSRMIHQTDFKKYLLEFLKKGICIGESAGSIIFENDIKWYYDVKKGTKPKYDIILDSYKGLGLTDLNIYPHYNKELDEMRSKISQYEKDHNFKVTPLNDGEFVLLNIG